MDSPDLECVLNFCNEIRTELDRPPVAKLRKGMPSDGLSCPLANTINYKCRNKVEIDGLTADFWNPEKQLSVPLPPCATDFVDEFDKGNLHHFVGEGWYE